MPFLVVDTETTGLDPQQNRIIEIAWVLFENGQVTHSQARLCSIIEPLPPEITRITGINASMLEGQPEFSTHASDFIVACSKASYLVAYNVPFDRAFIGSEFERAGQEVPALPWLDPCVYIKEIDKFKKGKKLSDAAARWGVELDGAHRALADATAAGKLFLKLMPHLKADSVEEMLAVENAWRAKQQKEYEEYRSRRSF